MVHAAVECHRRGKAENQPHRTGMGIPDSSPGPGPCEPPTKGGMHGATAKGSHPATLAMRQGGECQLRRLRAHGSHLFPGWHPESLGAGTGPACRQRRSRPRDKKNGKHCVRRNDWGICVTRPAGCHVEPLPGTGTWNRKVAGREGPASSVIPGWLAAGAAASSSTCPPIRQAIENPRAQIGIRKKRLPLRPGLICSTGWKNRRASLTG